MNQIRNENWESVFYDTWVSPLSYMTKKWTLSLSPITYKAYVSCSVWLFVILNNPQLLWCLLPILMIVWLFSMKVWRNFPVFPKPGDPSEYRQAVKCCNNLFTAPSMRVKWSNISRVPTPQTVDKDIALSHIAAFRMSRWFRKCLCQYQPVLKVSIKMQKCIEHRRCREFADLWNKYGMLYMVWTSFCRNKTMEQKQICFRDPGAIYDEVIKNHQKLAIH